MIFGRTELIIGESGAENRQDSVGKVRLLVATQKFAIEGLTSRKQR